MIYGQQNSILDTFSGILITASTSGTLRFLELRSKHFEYSGRQAALFRKQADRSISQQIRLRIFGAQKGT
jgi:hypothetical protein